MTVTETPKKSPSKGRTMAVAVLRAASEHLATEEGTAEGAMQAGYQAARTEHVKHEGGRARKAAEAHTADRFHPKRYGPWFIRYTVALPWYLAGRRHAHHIHEASEVLGRQRAAAQVDMWESVAQAATSGTRLGATTQRLLTPPAAASKGATPAKH